MSTIDALAEDLLRSLLVADPLEATLIGFRDYDAHLADLSVTARADRRIDRARIREAAAAVDASTLTPQESLTRDVILAQLDYADDVDAVGSLEFTVAAFPVAPASILLAYLRLIVLTDEVQALAYEQRLSEIPRYLAQARQRLDEGRMAGNTPVRRLVVAALAQIDAFLSAPISPFLLQPPAGWSGGDAWSARLAGLVDGTVKPAFEDFADALRNEVLPTARDDDRPGLVHLPGGAEKYAALVRVHTTTDVPPAEYHRIGLNLIAGIHSEFQAIGAAVLGLSDVREIFDRLQSDPALRWDSAASIIAAAEATVRRAEAESRTWFGRRPAAVCALAQIPELEAEGAAPAYYMPPSLDGSRPGTYFTNVNRPHERTTFDLESVAFHEAVPGHHFQISLALELPDLPVLRRLPLFTAYVEGWGLYSERLADEMGLYSSDLQRLGMLSADAWRAARLVVDTGLHAMGWSRSQAVEYMAANTPVAPIDVESEIDRYIAYPGQALSYMAGRLELQRLRRHAQAALGERFRVADFHDVVLGSGALPLSVLGRVVDDWIARS